MRLPVLLLLLSALIATPSAVAQAPIVLTLEEAIARAQRSSPASRMARLQFEEARWMNRGLEARYRPSLSLAGNAPGLFRSITEVQQNDGSMRYVSQSRTYSTVGLALQQQVPLTGGTVSVSSGLSRIDLLGEFEQNQWQSSPVVVSYSQPLFQFNRMKWERRIGAMQYRADERELAEEMAGIGVDVTNLFFNVVIARMNVENATFNVAVNDTIYGLSEGRYELGRIAENELLQSELALLNAQTSLSDARIAYDRAVQDLRMALGLPYDARIEVETPVDVPEGSVDPRRAVAEARKNRAAFMNLDLTTLQAEQEVSRRRSATGFSATMDFSYGLNQTGETLSGVYADPLNQQRFSVGFQVPLYGATGSKSEYRAAMAAADRTAEAVALRREELEQEVHFEALQFRQLQDQLRIAAKADTIAARRFEVARNRYAIGSIDITFLFDAQQAKDAARQAYIRTLRQYWITHHRLRLLTLYDFARDEPLTFH